MIGKHRKNSEGKKKLSHPERSSGHNSHITAWSHTPQNLKCMKQNDVLLMEQGYEGKDCQTFCIK